MPSLPFHDFFSLLSLSFHSKVWLVFFGYILLFRSMDLEAFAEVAVCYTVLLCSSEGNSFQIYVLEAQILFIHFLKVYIINALLLQCCGFKIIYV